MSDNHRPISVIFVHRILTVGGAEEIRLSLLAHLDPKKYAVRFVCFSDKGVIGEELEALGYPVDVLHTSDRWFNPLATLRLAFYLRRHPCTILHASLFSVNLHARIAARLARVPIVVCEEQSDYERYNARLGWLMRPLHRFLARWADVFTVPSEAVKRTLIAEEGLPEEQFVVLYNTALPGRFLSPLSPQEARQRLGLPREGPLIGFTASLARRKGQFYLIEATKRLAEAYPDICCLLIGAGPERQRLEEAIKKDNLEDRVFLLGMRRDVPEVLRALDIYVSPAVEEAFGINILEAMLMGLPVVATAVGGVPEVVEDGVTGLLVPARDPSILAGAVARLLKDRALAEKMGLAGRGRALEVFGPESYVSTMEGLWDTLIKRKRPAAFQEAEG